MDNNPNNQEIQNQKDEPWQCSLTDVSELILAPYKNRIFTDI